jgi:hypothetical protein
MKLKSLLFVLIAISSSQISKAQISKGAIFLGGQVGFGSRKVDANFLNEDAKRTNALIAPAVGLVTKNNLVIGFDVPFVFYNDENENPDYTDYKQLNVGAGVFVRQYFEVANRFYLFAQGRFGGDYISNRQTYQVSTTKEKGFAVNLSFYPGVSYALKKNIHLESGFYNLASINYYNSKITNSNILNNTRKVSEFSLNAAASGQTTFSVGIRFFLTGRA